MANFTAGTSFSDGVTNDVTAAKLNALVADAVPTSNLALTSTNGTIANFTASTANITLGTIPTLTAGTTTGTAGIFTSGTIATLNSTTPTFLGAITSSTNTINIGSGQIYKDSSGNVGIGTASPATKLQVIGTAAFGNGVGGRLQITTESNLGYIDSLNNAATAWQPLIERGEMIQFHTNPVGTTPTERLRIDSSGNVGVGTATLANYRLSVAGDSASQAVGIRLVDGNASGRTYSLRSDVGSFAIQAITGSAERLRIDSSGNVGIGQSSLTSTLTVNKAGTDTVIQMQEGGTNTAQIESFQSSLYLNVAGANNIIFRPNSTERMRIDSSGNLLVGTTDSATISGVGVKFLASATEPLMGYVINTTSNTSNYHIYNTNATNNGYRFYVTANGGVSNFSANNVNLSDERLKTNINLSGNYLDKICSIPVKTFNYKDQGEDTEKTIGVLAQEVEAHIPELVNNDGFGETPADGIPLKTIYQTDLQYVLMRCIQELKSENDSLKSRIEALEAA